MWNFVRNLRCVNVVAQQQLYGVALFAKRSTGSISSKKFFTIQHFIECQSSSYQKFTVLKCRLSDGGGMKKYLSFDVGSGGEKIAKKESEMGKSSEHEKSAEGETVKKGEPAWIGRKWEKLMYKCGLEINRSAPKEEQNAQRRKRSTVIATVFLGSSTLCGFLYFCIYYGWMKKDKDSEFSGILAPYHRIRKAYNRWRDFVVEPSREKLLPDPLPAPYWQPKYTIVIELMNVLVAPEWSYKTGNRLKKRPAVDYFLDVIGYPNFEVVIYTSESALTANPVVDALDPKQRVMYRLYRDCNKYMNGHYVKDLSRLNRDLSKVIFIDFDPEAFQLNPENVLRIPKWEGRLDDTALVDLAELLKTIHLSDVDDVRPTLQHYSQFDNPLKEFRDRAAKVAEMEEMQEKHQEQQRANAPVKQYQGRLFGFRRHE